MVAAAGAVHSGAVVAGAPVSGVAQGRRHLWPVDPAEQVVEAAVGVDQGGERDDQAGQVAAAVGAHEQLLVVGVHGVDQGEGVGDRLEETFLRREGRGHCGHVVVAGLLTRAVRVPGWSAVVRKQGCPRPRCRVAPMPG